MKYLEVKLSQLNQKYKLWSAETFKEFVRRKLSEREWVESIPSVVLPEVANFREHYLASKERFFLEKELSLLSQKGISMIYPGHSDFPEEFVRLAQPPLALTCWGSLNCLRSSRVGVVGSREPSHESKLWMEEELSEFLAVEKPVVVSGAARGVDQMAHSLALREGVPTVALIPSGFHEIYPSSFQEWVPAITEVGGCLISEYGLNVKMRKNHFVERNRLISALSNLLLLVEARKKSGTLITAKYAIEQHVPLGVLPGHPMNPRFSGSLELLAEGAALIRDALDLKIFYRSEMGLDLVVREQSASPEVVVPLKS